MALSLARGLTLYFCRHGETEANVAKRFQGITIDTPLTAKGREQATAIGNILARNVSDPAHLACVTSPLHRARVTMEIIRTTLHLPPQDYSTDARIEEINLGAWDGLTDDEARALDPAMFEKRGHDKWNVRVPGGGENYADVATRAESWIASLTADTFAVSHGAFTRILRGLFAGLTGQQMSALDEPQGVVFRVRGGEVVRLDPV
ncbi:MAG TPA: histidine phosphatase family protein [Rhizomicrobium sp.]|jgi:broad specificity phosphatase PhoE|nr:histidine phosphatase family protein [Rhizomicrobium sp.]